MWFQGLLLLQCFSFAQQVVAGHGSPGHSREFSVEFLSKRGAHKQAEPEIQKTALFGEAHGKDFDDLPNVLIRHRRITSMSFTGCGKDEHLGSIQTVFEVLGLPAQGSYTDPGLLHPIHGYGVGVKGTASIKLEADEYIERVDLTSYRAKSGFFHRSKRTRVGSITLHTNKGHSVTCGARSAADPSISWSFENKALLYLSGNAGDGVDALRGNFLKVENYFP